MKILIAGAGYLGLLLATRLKEQGHEVSGWVASGSSAEVLKQSGIHAICGDLADAGTWGRAGIFWDAIFFCASTSGGGLAAYEQVHRLGVGNGINFLAPGGRFLYTSSTSVYGQQKGEEVEESSETRPLAGGSKILLEAEERVLGTGGEVLRLAGIYGPQRCVYLQKLREGRATIPGDGTRWVNQIHREDAVAALLFLWNRSEKGQVWNVADDHPVQIKELYQWLCGETGLSLPVMGAAIVESKRGLSNKRVNNQKLRAAGWVPKYPSFRDGYGQLIR